jgi:hypothetical protein
MSCLCVDAAGLSYQVADGSGACQEVRIPAWSRPYLTSGCQYDFRSPHRDLVYLGLTCEAGGIWYRSRQKYLLIPLGPKTAERISQADWDASPVLWTSEQGDSGGRSPSDSLAYVEYKGRRFSRSGPKWPVSTSKDLLSPGRARIAIFSWDGVIRYPGGGDEGGFLFVTPGHFRGKYWIDIYDIASAARLIQIHGDFHGFDPIGGARSNMFLTGRYYVFSLDYEKERKMLVCDVDAAARNKDAIAEDPAPRFASHGQFRDIKEENPKARVLSVRDEPVIDPNTGRILAVDVTASLAVSAAGRYRLRIELDGIAAWFGRQEKLESDLEPGPRTITVRFTADSLRGFRTDGPWKIGFVELTHPNPEGTGVDYLRSETGKTQSYKLSEMASP